MSAALDLLDAAGSPRSTTAAARLRRRGDRVKRRAFVTLLGGAAATWPLAALAQQRERMRTVGVLTPYAAHDTEGQNRVTAFAQALQQLGWSVGQNARLLYRWRDGTSATMQKHAAELVALAPDVILADSSAALSPLLQATQVYNARLYGEIGGLVCYGAVFLDQFRRAAGYVTSHSAWARKNSSSSVL